MRRQSFIRNTSKAIKMIGFLLCLMMLVPTITWARSEKSEGFNVAGMIKFEKETGTIFVSLATKEEFGKMAHEITGEGQPTGRLRIKVSEKELKEKKVPFAFENVSPGEYMLLFVQDLDDSGTYDEIFLGFGAEPYSYYRPYRSRFKEPSFEQLKFEVSQDINDIEIELK